MELVDKVTIAVIALLAAIALSLRVYHATHGECDGGHACEANDNERVIR